MKSEHNIDENPDQKYPYLGKSSTYDYIVFFTSKNTGVVINSDSFEHPIGYSSVSWAENCFHELPANESVTLKN